MGFCGEKVTANCDNKRTYNEFLYSLFLSILKFDTYLPNFIGLIGGITLAKLKNCKTCGNQVAKSAKRCPHCGEKLKMGIFMKGLIGLGILILLGIVASLGGGEDSAEPATTTTTSTNDNEEKNKEEINEEQPLSNEGISSDVTIKVLGVETLSEVGGEFTKETAQGVFKVVTISLTNGQKDAITVDANSFKLVDSQGREFTYSSSAQISMDVEEDNGSDFFLKQLNPGLTQEGKIVFDVPADAAGLVLKATGGMMGEEITLKVE